MIDDEQRKRRRKEAVARHKIKHPDAQKEACARYRERHLEKTRKAARELAARKRVADPEAVRARERAKYHAVVEKSRHIAAMRRAHKLQATPPWADHDKIAAIYTKARRMSDETGIDFHVDHIVPLRSPLVCGFHCEANLMIVPAWFNHHKSNDVWPEMFA